MSGRSDLLILTGVLSPEHAQAGPTYTVTLNGNAVVLESDAVRIPHDQIPATLVIDADPDNDTHFAVSGTFAYAGNGTLTPQGDTSRAHFAPVRSASADATPVNDLAMTAMSLTVFFSRLQDVTFKALGFAAAGKHADFPNTKAELDTLLRTPTTVNVLQDPPVAAAKANFAEQSVAPKSGLTYFELRADVPKMLSVLWPDSVVRTHDTAASGVPYLLYFHPNAGQNHPEFYAGDYPFSHDFCYYQVIRYALYQASFRAIDPTVKGDPLLHDPFWKGIAHQIEAAGKDVVLVKPVNKPHKEIGSMAHADVTEMVLLEVGAFMFRLAGVYPEQPPPIGRVALASFSASTGLAIAFLRDNASHPFVTERLREVYSFDAPGAFRFPWLLQVGKWLKGDDTRIARAYGRATRAAEFKGLLGAEVSIPTTTPVFVDSADGRRTCATISNADWQAVSSMNVTFQEAHQLVSALLLTHAMRRSDF